MLKKIKLLLLTAAMLMPTVGMVVIAQPVSAVDLFHGICTPASNDTGTNGGQTDVCKESAKPSTGNPIVKGIMIGIDGISLIVGIAAVIIIVISGFSMVTSNGDPQKVSKARESIIYALIGLIIAGIAGAIVTFVLSNL